MGTPTVGAYIAHMTWADYRLSAPPPEIAAVRLVRMNARTVAVRSTVWRRATLVGLTDYTAVLTRATAARRGGEFAN